MKTMKGKLLKKLKTMKAIGYLKPAERILHSYASDGYIHTSPPQLIHSPVMPVQVPEDSKMTLWCSVQEQEPEIIDVSELMKDLEDDQELELEDKQNIRPDVKVKKFESSSQNVESFSLLKPKNGTLLVKDLQEIDGNVTPLDKEMELEDEMNDKENIRPDVNVKKFDSYRETVENFSSLKQKNETFEVKELQVDDEKIAPLDQEMELECEIYDKENIVLGVKVKKSESLGENVENFSSLKPKSETFDRKVTPLAEIDVSNFRQPDLDSGSLFDPNLLAAFEQAVLIAKAQEEERMAKIEEEIFKAIEVKDDEVNEPPFKARKLEEIIDPLLEFEEKCPPGGCHSVILYTTGLRGIRKTFEDCHSIRFLLENFRVLFFERDISMHSEFKEELWRILDGKVVPPRLFIKGRYIGGAEEVLTLHEQGKLRPLLEGIPIDYSQCPCEGCVGMKFVMCFKCNGSQKIVVEDKNEAMKCLECNENGLILCPYCR